MAEPTCGAEWEALGQRLIASGGLAQAAECFERAARLEPKSAIVRARLAKVRLALQQHDAAETVLAEACALEPANAGWLVLLAYVLREQNQAEAALDACARALAIDPSNLHAAVASALMIPPIYADNADVGAWRQRFTAGLQRLCATLPTWLSRPAEVLTLEWQNFLLAYQGGNDVLLQSGYSDFLGTLLGAAVPELQAPLAPARSSDGRIRVGFLSSEFRVCTIGDYFVRWASDLPRKRFHVTTIHTGAVADERTAEFARGSEAFLHATGGVERIARAVRACELDVVVLPDVGSSASSALLANLRLAPIQCAAWGHPTTTGSGFVEHFLSCATMEPTDAATHYRESLLLLPGIGVRYRAPEIAPPGPRARFGLADAQHVYLCPQSLYKVHPDTDALILGILARDDRAAVLFFAATAQGQTRAFAERLNRGMRQRGIAPRQQIKFLPRMSRGDFLAVMRVADVMIDAMHWSGGNTTLDALACALPVVTLEGRTMRGRQSAAMLRLAGLPELIARDADDYVELAVGVATDKARRAELSRRMRDGQSRVFDRAEPIAALGELLTHVHNLRARRQS